MVFGVVFMGVGGVAELAAPVHSLAWRAVPAALFGLGTALVLDEFALILHLRDVYWTNQGRISVDAVFIAMGVTALLLIGVSPVGVESVADDYRLPGSPGGDRHGHRGSWSCCSCSRAITLLKGKIWTALLGLFVPPVFIVGAIRLGRPGSPWARWRYRSDRGRLARATRREQQSARSPSSARRSGSRTCSLAATPTSRPPAGRQPWPMAERQPTLSSCYEPTE